jgi:hypothetical protein
MTASAGGGWKPIEDYAAIGNLRTVALIGRLMAQLCENDLVYRYKADDGVAGGSPAARTTSAYSPSRSTPQRAASSATSRRPSPTLA